MWETPYKHQENRHCGRGTDRGIVLKFISALSICALPSSGHWGIGCLSPTSSSSALHRAAAHRCAFSVNIGQGFLLPPLLYLGEEMGMERWQYPGKVPVVSTDGYRSPQPFICVTPSLSVQPREGLCHSHRFIRRHGVWGVFEAVTCWAILLFYFQPPTARSPRLCTGVTTEIPQRPPDYLISWFIKKYFLFPYTLNWTKKKRENYIICCAKILQALSDVFTENSPPCWEAQEAVSTETSVAFYLMVCSDPNFCTLHTCFPAPWFHF